jgi:hypothetical protein
MVQLVAELSSSQKRLISRRSFAQGPLMISCFANNDGFFLCQMIEAATL